MKKFNFKTLIYLFFSVLYVSYSCLPVNAGTDCTIEDLKPDENGLIIAKFTSKLVKEEISTTQIEIVKYFEVTEDGVDVDGKLLQTGYYTVADEVSETTVPFTPTEAEAAVSVGGDTVGVVDGKPEQTEDGVTVGEGNDINKPTEAEAAVSVGGDTVGVVDGKPEQTGANVRVSGVTAKDIFDSYSYIGIEDTKGQESKEILNVGCYKNHDGDYGASSYHIELKILKADGTQQELRMVENQSDDVDEEHFKIISCKTEIIRDEVRHRKFLKITWRLEVLEHNEGAIYFVREAMGPAIYVGQYMQAGEMDFKTDKF